jgi:hypothetical protein
LSSDELFGGVVVLGNCLQLALERKNGNTKYNTERRNVNKAATSFTRPGYIVQIW